MAGSRTLQLGNSRGGQRVAELLALTLRGTDDRGNPSVRLCKAHQVDQPPFVLLDDTHPQAIPHRPKCTELRHGHQDVLPAASEPTGLRSDAAIGWARAAKPRPREAPSCSAEANLMRRNGRCCRGTIGGATGSSCADRGAGPVRRRAAAFRLSALVRTAGKPAGRTRVRWI